MGVPHRMHGRGARLTIDERDLTDQLAATDLAELLRMTVVPAAGRPQAARGHEVRGITGVALLEQGVAGPQVHSVRQCLHQRERVRIEHAEPLVEVGDELRPAESFERAAGQRLRGAGVVLQQLLEGVARDGDHVDGRQSADRCRSSVTAQHADLPDDGSSRERGHTLLLRRRCRAQPPDHR